MFFLPLMQVKDTKWAPKAAVHGSPLERLGDEAGIYSQAGTFADMPWKEWESSTLAILPVWWQGGKFSRDDYRVDCGNGCYEFEFLQVVESVQSVASSSAR